MEKNQDVVQVRMILPDFINLLISKYENRITCSGTVAHTLRSFHNACRKPNWMRTDSHFPTRSTLGLTTVHLHQAELVTPSQLALLHYSGCGTSGRGKCMLGQFTGIAVFHGGLSLSACSLCRCSASACGIKLLEGRSSFFNKNLGVTGKSNINFKYPKPKLK